MHQPIGAAFGSASFHTSSHQPSRVLKFDRAVGSRLHATYTARLERPPRRIEPQVDPLCKHPVHGDVEVLDEDDPVLQVALVGELDHGAQQPLSALVAGMGLAGENDLNRPVGITEDTCQALRVAQEQRRPLVGDESPDEADCERPGVQETGGGCEELFSGASAGELLSLVVTGELDEPGPSATTRIPQADVLGPDELAPGFGRPRRCLPIRAQLVIDELLDVARDPGLEVNAVRDMSDRHLAEGQSRPKAAPLFAGHVAVQAAHAVAGAGQAQGEHGRAEGVTWVLGPVSTE